MSGHGKGISFSSSPHHTFLLTLTHILCLMCFLANMYTDMTSMPKQANVKEFLRLKINAT